MVSSLESTVWTRKDSIIPTAAVLHEQFGCPLRVLVVWKRPDADGLDVKDRASVFCEAFSDFLADRRG